jgi:ribosomal protein S18 acetylase RimI-like enzyme
MLWLLTETNQALEMTGETVVAIQKGLSEELITPAAELFVDTLGEKFVSVLGDEARAVSLLEKNSNLNICFSAVEHGSLLGVLAFETDKQSFIAPDFKELKTQYGGFNGLLRAGGFALLEHKPKPDEIHIEGIAVAANARGKGVGTKLINNLFTFAKSEGFDRATL